MTYNIRSNGKFTKHYATDTLKAIPLHWWMKLAILSGWFLIYLLSNYHSNVTEYAQAEAIPPVATSTPIIIEVSYSKERVQELIKEAFPDAPIMLKVAACESGFLQHAYNPTNDSHDGGVFQISQKYHGQQMEKLGLDPYDVKDNIAYARILYDRNGLRDWSASKHCWSK